MAFVSAQKSRVHVGDFNFTVVTAQVGADAQVDMLDVTTLNDTAKNFIPGQDTSTENLSGWLDVDATSNANFDQLNDIKSVGTVEPFSYAPEGFGIGSPVWMAPVLASNITFGSQVGDKASFSLDLQTSGPTELGRSIHNLGAETVDANGTSYDNAALTSNGGVGHLHVTAYSGLTSASIIVEHSTNDSVWATLGTFTSVTALTSEVLTIAAGTTVNRYLRIRTDVTGTGSVTFSVAFARR